MAGARIPVEGRTQRARADIRRMVVQSVVTAFGQDYRHFQRMVGPKDTDLSIQPPPPRETTDDLKKSRDKGGRVDSSKPTKNGRADSMRPTKSGRADSMRPGKRGRADAPKDAKPEAGRSDSSKPKKAESKSRAKKSKKDEAEAST